MSNMLVVKNVNPDVKDKLKKVAMRRTGSPNISKLIRFLIANEIKNFDESTVEINFKGKKERITFSLPQDAARALDEICERRISTRSQFVSYLVYEAIRNPQLLTDEIETLRRSNYQLAKIGSNLNQIARTFNILVLDKESGKLPKIGKDIANLRKVIRQHIRLVLSVLDAEMGMYIERRGGRRVKKNK